MKILFRLIELRNGLRCMLVTNNLHGDDDEEQPLYTRLFSGDYSGYGSDWPHRSTVYSARAVCADL